MNIIIVNDFAFVNGGAGKIAINTAKLLANNGDHVILFTAVGPIADDLHGIENLKVVCLEQYDILNDPFRLRAIIQGLWNFRAKRTFKQLLKSYSPQDTVIHIHTLQKAVSTSILPVARKMGFKTLYHGHDYGVACPNLGFYNYQRDEICHRNALSVDCLLCDCDSRSFLHKCWRVVRLIVQKYIGGLPDKLDCFIYISKFSLNIMKPYLNNVKQLELVPNIIDVSQSSRVEAEKNSYIVFVGRMSPEKNPQIVARVTKKLGLPVIFIGSGVLEDKVKHINPVAEITGWVGREEIEKYMQTARVLVFPSKWYEAAPLTILEAMAYGVPCIVSDACAGKEAVVDGENGMIFSSDDDDELIEKLSKLDDDKVKMMSRAAYDGFWGKNYNEKVYLERLKRIYSNLLQNGR